MKKKISQSKPLFVIITFRVMLQSENDFLRLIQSLIAPIFESLEKIYSVKYLKVKTRPIVIDNNAKNEIHFNVKRGLFRFFPFSLFLFIKKQKPSIVFVHGFIFPIQLLSLFFFLDKSTKVIVQHHAEKPFKNIFKRWLQKIVYSRADAYLFASSELARPFEDYNIIKDSCRINEVMEFSSCFVNKNMERPAHSFLWVGRLDANKDPITMLKGFNLYLNHNPIAKLTMIYASAIIESEVKSFIQKNNMTSSVILLGKVSHDQLENWYNSSDFFISASHYEGSGIAFCEAMSCGCIPIGTNIASFRTMTNNGDCGMLFEVANEMDLFSKLRESEKVKIDDMRKQVLLQFQNNLSFNAIGLRIEEVANNLLSKFEL